MGDLGAEANRVAGAEFAAEANPKSTDRIVCATKIIEALLVVGVDVVVGEFGEEAGGVAGAEFAAEAA